MELVTSRFDYGEVPAPAGYRVTEAFYRRGSGAAGSRRRSVEKLAQHPGAMVRLRRGHGLAIGDPDIRHLQWSAVPQIDAGLLAGTSTPLVVTVHEPTPRRPRRGQQGALGRLLRGADAVITHTDGGRKTVVDAYRVPKERTHVIEHGAFTHVARVDPTPLDPELDRWLGSGPTILFFGLLRPWKGVDVLLDAFSRVQRPDARLLVVGRPRMDTAPLRALADDRVRFVERFVSDSEVPTLFARADIVALPYREVEQSGVLATALAFGRPIVCSRVGGFAETVERHGVAALVPPGDPKALAVELVTLLDDPARRRSLAFAARRAADGPLAWPTVAEQTMDLYRSLA